jgi:hypothetical protein
VRRLYDQAPTTGAKDELARVEAFVSLLGNVPIFAAFKALLAEMTGDPKWESLCPPLVSMDRDARKAWLASVARVPALSRNATPDEPRAAHACR